MTDPLTIVALDIHNFKRIKAFHAEIGPDDGPLIVIEGRNGHGKSSVLDAIWLTLAGGAAKGAVAQPVQEGTPGATATIDLGDLQVTRTWMASGKTELRVVDADRVPLSSPQTKLDALLGKLGFDPQAFFTMKAADQRQALLETLDLPDGWLADIDARRKEVFEERTGINRQVRDLEGELRDMPMLDPTAPDEEQSATDLLRRLQEATEQRAANDRARAELAAIQERKAALDADIERIEQQLAEARATQRETGAEIVRTAVVVAALEDPDIAAIEAQAADVEEVNARVRANRRRREAEERFTRVKARAEERTAELEAIDREKTETIAAAGLPDPDLGLSDDGVTYKGRPLKDASQAEQLRVAMAIAMAGNPTIRVIRMTEGSLFDRTSLQLVADLAAEHGFQVWIERVADEPSDDDGAIFITEGEVAS